MVNNNSTLLATLASKFNGDASKRMTIPVANQEGQPIGTLACIDRAMISEDLIISKLTMWRQRYMRYFLTQFDATEARTRKWLESIVIPSPDRILFAILLPAGEIIGNFGVCNMSDSSGELDNLIRGGKGGDLKLIFYCEIALLSWMFGKLNFQAANLHVFSNNFPTINLHSSVGFSVLQSTPLTQRTSPGLIEYLVGSQDEAPVEFTYLEMGISKDVFIDLHPWVQSVYINHWG